MAQALIGLGSNIEPRRDYLKLAVSRLKQAPFNLLKLSQVYETEPMDVTDQASFLNMAAWIEADLDPMQFLNCLQGIEAEAGKHVVVRRGPRSLDLDLWSVDGAQIKLPSLTLPHPRIPERPFVLIPLAEIAPQWRNPLNGFSASEMLQRLPKPWPAVKLLGPL